MESAELQRRADQIAKLVSGMRQVDWCRISQAINKKFASETGKIVLTDSEAIKDAIKVELW